MRFACCTVVALAVLPFCLHAAVIASAGQNNDNNYLEDSPRAGRAVAADTTATATGNWAMVARIADECVKDADTAACVAVKAAAALERATRMTGNVQVLPGLTLVKDEGSSQRDSRALPSEEELRNQLQDASDDHSSKVATMVVDSALRFLQSRTLQFKFPQTNSEEISRAIEEGECLCINYRLFIYRKI